MTQRTFNWHSTTDDILKGVDLAGKIVAITGPTSGIGVETARSLAAHGAKVVLFCRNVQAGGDLKEKILAEKPNAVVDIIRCDLMSLDSVRTAAEEFCLANSVLHALILNAGVYGPSEGLTKDGYETAFGVNHLAHFYLTQLLLSRLRAARGARIVVVASESHGQTPLKDTMTVDTMVEVLCATRPATSVKQAFDAYGSSKLCNVLFAFEFNRRHAEKDKVTANALHPGTAIATGISRSSWLAKIVTTLGKPFTKSVAQGAATSVYCATADELEGLGGRYLVDCNEAKHHPLADNEMLQQALWTASEDAIRKFEAAKGHAN